MEETGWETVSKCEDSIQMNRTERGRMWTRYTYLAQDNVHLQVAKMCFWEPPRLGVS